MRIYFQCAEFKAKSISYPKGVRLAKDGKENEHMKVKTVTNRETCIAIAVRKMTQEQLQIVEFILQLFLSELMGSLNLLLGRRHYFCYLHILVLPSEGTCHSLSSLCPPTPRSRPFLQWKIKKSPQASPKRCPRVKIDKNC